MLRYGLFLLLFCFVSMASAYGELGHAVICDIAFRSLTIEVQKEVKKLLRETPYKTFAQACNWADHIRSNDKYDFAKPHHYINIARNTGNVSRVQDCNVNGCIVDAINAYIAVLSGRPRDKNIPAGLYVFKRSEALMFLGHFVGDIHQPLHVSYAEDRGGNLVAVEAAFVDKATNLHAVWDNYLITQEKVTQEKTDWRKLGKDLYGEIRKEYMNSWNDLSPLVWAQESYNFTQIIYQRLPADKKLGEQYFLENNAIVLERIKIAGYRLGKVLNIAIATYNKYSPAQ